VSGVKVTQRQDTLSADAALPGRVGDQFGRSPRRRLRRSPLTFVRTRERVVLVGSVIKKRRKRMAKKKHRKLLKKTRIQRRNKK
jgi:hypothetical protein